MTYLELVNRVLRRLREDDVASVETNAYSKLIGELVNEAKREVEDAFDWVALRDTIQATTISGEFRISFSNVGPRFKTLSVFDDTNDTYLELKNSEWLSEQFNTNPVSGKPIYYDYTGLDGDDYQMDLYPIPDGEYIININLIRPQLDLSTDGTELKVHEYPVLLGAYAKAIAERGDDNGMQYQIAYKAYQDALSDAIQIDSRKNGGASLEWGCYPTKDNWHYGN